MKDVKVTLTPEEAVQIAAALCYMVGSGKADESLLHVAQHLIKVATGSFW